MRRPPLHLVFLCAWLPCSFVGCVRVISEGSGPYDDHATFAFNITRSWHGSGYTALPQPAGRSAWQAWTNGYWQDRNEVYSYCIFDDPYWPNGDPGLGALNPLPPLVRRTYIIGVNRAIVLAALVLGWLAFAAMRWRYLRHRDPTRPAFEVIPPQRP